MIDCYRRRCLLLFVLTSRWHVIAAAGGRRQREPDDGGVDVAADDDGWSDDKHFMDVYSLQSGPRQLEFGHVFEDPNVWEQRYERKDFDGQRYQGKVKWGDKDGGYGEQYWDLNHGRYGETAPDEQRVRETRDGPVVYDEPKTTAAHPSGPRRTGRSDASVAVRERFDVRTGMVMDEATGNKYVF